jgi:hypothetical protein
MAEPIALQVKPPAPMSLGEMLNIARGAQQYQQAEQINPLVLQEAQSKVQTAQTGAESSKFDFANKQILGVTNRLTGLINDKDIIAAEQNPESVDKKKLTEKLSRYAYEQSNALGIRKDRADELIAPYLQEADTNPKGLRDFLKQKLLTTLDQGSRATTLGNVGVSTVPTGVQPAQSATPSAETSNLNLTYQPRLANDFRPFAPNEENATKLGFTKKSALTSTFNDLGKINYNIDQVIKDATKIQKEATLPETGPIGGMKRRFAELTGDSTYQKLEKDLANVIAANEKALGHQTDSGRQLQEAAGGKLGYDPQVLMDIARRAKGDTKNIEMQTKAIQNFTKKFGDNNVSAFEEAWGTNSDARIFQGLNIMESNMSNEEKRKALQKIYVDENNQPLPKEEIDKLRQKQNNLFRLRDTGGL